MGRLAARISSMTCCFAAAISGLKSAVGSRVVVKVHLAVEVGVAVVGVFDQDGGVVDRFVVEQRGGRRLVDVQPAEDDERGRRERGLGARRAHVAGQACLAKQRVSTLRGSGIEA